MSDQTTFTDEHLTAFLDGEADDALARRIQDAASKTPRPPTQTLAQDWTHCAFQSLT